MVSRPPRAGTHAAHGAGLGITVTTVPKRWVAEQTFGTSMLHRRLARDYEKLPASSESHLYWAATDRMTRRLTSTTTRRRDTPAGDRAGDPVAVAAA